MAKKLKKLLENTANKVRKHAKFAALMTNRDTGVKPWAIRALQSDHPMTYSGAESMEANIKATRENYNKAYREKPKFQFGGGRSGTGGAGGTWNRGGEGEEDVVDYVQYDLLPGGGTKPTNFSQAFAEARKQGLKTFTYKGKEYTTDLDNSPKDNSPKDNSKEPTMVQRTVYDKDKKIIRDSTSYAPYTLQPLGRYKRTRTYKGGKLRDTSYSLDI